MRSGRKDSDDINDATSTQESETNTFHTQTISGLEPDNVYSFQIYSDAWFNTQIDLVKSLIWKK